MIELSHLLEILGYWPRTAFDVAFGDLVIDERGFGPALHELGKRPLIEPSVGAAFRGAFWKAQSPAARSRGFPVDQPGGEIRPVEQNLGTQEHGGRGHAALDLGETCAWLTIAAVRASAAIARAKGMAARQRPMQGRQFAAWSSD